MCPSCCLVLFLSPPWLLLNPDSPNKVRNSFHLYCSPPSNTQSGTNIHDSTNSTDYWCTDNWTSHSRSPCCNTVQTQTKAVMCLTVSFLTLHILTLSQAVNQIARDTSVHIPCKTSITNDYLNQALMDVLFVDNRSCVTVWVAWCLKYGVMCFM